MTIEIRVSQARVPWLMAGVALVLMLLGLQPGLAETGVDAEAQPPIGALDHVGVAVTDTDPAVGFFEEVLGCEVTLRFGPLSDPGGNSMRDTLNVHPRAVIHQITLLLCGGGSQIELLEYEAPEQDFDHPRNSDVGGHHLAFYVDDMARAASWLRANDVETFAGPVSVVEGPAAGRSILYFRAPWGLHMELISYPGGSGRRE